MGASDTIHAEDVLASLHLASNEPFTFIDDDRIAALDAVAVGVACVARQRHHMQQVAVLACVLLVFHFLEFDGFSGDLQSFSELGHRGKVSI